ncbi:putative long-chain-fatty-acid-CoA ligase, partial [Leptomonas seymouri]
DEDGWFHTGDIGSIDSEGRVSVVGRIKALAKNCLGEYIALETLEAIYAGHPLVLNNGVCVLVNPTKNYIGALIMTDASKVKRFAKEHNIQGEYPALLKNKELLKKAAESMSEVAKSAKRKSFESVRSVRLVDDEWSPENGVLTAAMKLKRRVIDERYANEIADMFAQ